MSLIDRAVAGIERRLMVGRRRSRAFDHFCRAWGRYFGVLGGRLAAAIAYYGFFAVFALGLIAYWIFGAVLEGSDRVNDAADQFLRRNLPFLDPEEIQDTSNRVGVVGLILLALTGIAWVEAIRSSQRLIHGLEQQPGYVVIRQVVDLFVLIGVFLLLGLSVGAIDAVESLLRWLFGTQSLGLSISSWLLALLINMVLAAALLVALPRLRMTFRRVFPPVLMVALGIMLLNTVGRHYLVRTERNPAYTVVASAVGVLAYLYLLNQLLLFGAALAATSRHGRVTDLVSKAPAPSSADSDEADSDDADSGSPPSPKPPPPGHAG